MDDLTGYDRTWLSLTIQAPGYMAHVEKQVQVRGPDEADDPSPDYSLKRSEVLEGRVVVASGGEPVPNASVKSA